LLAAFELSRLPATVRGSTSHAGVMTVCASSSVCHSGGGPIVAEKNPVTATR
jgi:hypothetical protein